MPDECLPSIGQACGDTTTSERGQPQTPNESTLLPADSHARTSVMLERVQAWAESEADYFLSLSESFAKWDQDSLSWKTSQRCLLEDWETFLGRWPRSGTMRNGIAYRLRPLVPISGVTECLSLPIVPTPVACDFKGSGRIRIERGANSNLRDWWNMNYRFVYPPARHSEYLMGFPIGWTDLGD